MPNIDPQVVARAFRLKKQIEALEEERRELLDSLGELTPDKYVAGDYILVVSENKRFDEATAKRNLPPHLFEMILKRKPDSALAKAQLEADEYALCQKQFAPKREIKRVEDDK